MGFFNGKKKESKTQRENMDYLNDMKFTLGDESVMQNKLNLYEIKLNKYANFFMQIEARIRSMEERLKGLENSVNIILSSTEQMRQQPVMTPPPETKKTLLQEWLDKKKGTP